MDANIVLPPHFDLTGQVTIQNTPDFMGNYSFVYRGTVGGNLVAVKIIKATGKPKSMKRKVLRERVVWGSTSHPNIHPFSGYADDPAFGPFGALVSPWCAKGDASLFLKQNGQRMMVTERIRLWKGVINGIVYLHDQVPPIVHGDLKPGNVLIDDFGAPRICDFGLARIFLERGSTGTTTTSEHTGTARYLAPELVASDTTVYPTLASDVYALGCLGLDFIYLRQPFSNHPNNLRGQIFRDLRRGLAPAAERPRRAWPSLRAWSILTGCWDSDPLSRPSAPTAACMLTRTTFTFPTTVLKRIVHFVDIMWKGILVDSLPGWEKRCDCLRHLCLVSKAYRACVTPVLYRAIHLNLGKPRCLPPLLYALDSTSTKALLSPQEPDGYGTGTEMLTLSMPERGPYQHNLSVGIRDVVNKSPGLRLLTIHSYVIFDASFKLSLLTTLSLDRVDLTILFDHTPTLQALESLQRLSINACHDGGFSTRPFWEPHPRVYLPNLLEISFYGTSDKPKPFAKISTWTMPRLRSLHFTEADYIVYWLQKDFVKLLRTHGSQLQHLNLVCRHIDEEYIFDVLNLCTSLRSLDINGDVSLATLLSRHARLEKIRAAARRKVDSMADQLINEAIHALKSLKLEAKTSFPKLIEVELSAQISTSSSHRNATASFRTGDEFITFRYENRTYKIFDGQTDLVGGYFGQAVDCADFVTFGHF